MKLRDLGAKPPAEWFQMILDWSRRKLTFEDNLDCQILQTSIGTGETEVGHSLGRAPRFIVEMAQYPNGTSTLAFTRAPTANKVYLKRGTAGACTLLLM